MRAARKEKGCGSGGFCAGAGDEFFAFADAALDGRKRSRAERLEIGAVLDQFHENLVAVGGKNSPNSRESTSASVWPMRKEPTGFRKSAVNTTPQRHFRREFRPVARAGGTKGGSVLPSG